MNKLNILLFLGFWLGCTFTKTRMDSFQPPNVLVIMVDDLNDNIGVLGGHPQAKTPNIDRFAQSATTFLQAYCNAPMCGPSRASMFTGVYPHHSINFFQESWLKNEVLTNTRTMMEQFKMAGYEVIGTGKIMHHNKKEIWTHFENEADYTPTPFDGEQQVPHPDVPKPFSEIGWVDGSLGSFVNLEGRTTEEGKPLNWTTGNAKRGFKPMRYINDADRDPTPDEINAEWTAQKIKKLAKRASKQPFFLAVGFLRPHTPLVAPKTYFDRFPLENIELIDIKENDRDDTHLKAAYLGDVFTLRMGTRMLESISTAYGSREMGLKKWTQAYLACVAAVDDNIGQVLTALRESGLDKNTIVVLASDHGFHMGEKDWLYKNSLWEESTRVPLMMRVPNITKANSKVVAPVSLIDVYPTLVDLCNLSTETTKNEKGHPLDGKSLRPFLQNSNHKSREEASAALSVVFAGNDYKNDPAMQHYAIRAQRYRYILYNNGEEELYDHKKDPFEWTNLAETHQEVLKIMREKMKSVVLPIELAGFK